MLRLEYWVLVAAVALPLAGCGGKKATYYAGPPSTLAGEPLVANPDQGCTQAVSAWFDRADANKDGSLTLAEARGDSETFFRAVDADGSGSLTPVEITNYRVKVYPPEYLGTLATPLPPSSPPAKTPGGSELPDPERRRFMMTPATADPVMAADANLDFQVTRDEFDAKLAERGGRLDVNRDGKLSREEILASCRSG